MASFFQLVPACLLWLVTQILQYWFFTPCLGDRNLFLPLSSGTSSISATILTCTMFQRKHLSRSNNWGEAVWDNFHPILAVKKSQNVTPPAQQIIKNTPGRVCCPQKVSSHHVFTVWLKYHLSNTYIYVTHTYMATTHPSLPLFLGAHASRAKAQVPTEARDAQLTQGCVWPGLGAAALIRVSARLGACVLGGAWGNRGAAWCGVIRCGVVWRGIVWYGVVWCGMAWCGVAWYGVA